MERNTRAVVMADIRSRISWSAWSWAVSVRHVAAACPVPQGQGQAQGSWSGFGAGLWSGSGLGVVDRSAHCWAPCACIVSATHFDAGIAHATRTAGPGNPGRCARSPALNLFCWLFCQGPGSAAPVRSRFSVQSPHEAMAQAMMNGSRMMTPHGGDGGGGGSEGPLGPRRASESAVQTQQWTPQPGYHHHGQQQHQHQQHQPHQQLSRMLPAGLQTSSGGMMSPSATNGCGAFGLGALCQDDGCRHAGSCWCHPDMVHTRSRKQACYAVTSVI